MKYEDLNNVLLNSLKDFLLSVDIELILFNKLSGNNSFKSFLPNILINEGNLIITPKTKIDYILHEAGHICVTPKKYKKFLNGKLDINSWITKASKEIGLYPDIIYDEIEYSNEFSAQGWSYFACKEIGLNPLDILNVMFSNNIVDAIESGFNHSMGSIQSTNLFYNKMLEKKNSQQLISWIKN